MNTITRVFFGFAATVVFVSPSYAANVACGDTIDGESIVLDGDVPNCAGTAVTLTNGAVLDMNGHFISCDGSMFTIGVNVQNGSTLKNGGVYGCQFSGVQVAGSSGSTVSGVHANNNGTGFNVFATGSSTLKNNFANNNLNAGFFITAAAHKVSGSAAAQNGTHGFYVTGAGSILSNCTASNNSGMGFELVATVKLKNDVATANQNGFDITGIGSSLSSVKAIANNGAGFIVAGSGSKVSKSNASGNFGAGIYVTGDTNSVSGNTLMGNIYAIYTETTADGNTLSKNLAPGSDFYTATAGCGTNVWTSNVGDVNDPCIQ